MESIPRLSLVLYTGQEYKCRELSMSTVFLGINKIAEKEEEKEEEEVRKIPGIRVASKRGEMIGALLGETHLETRRTTPWGCSQSFACHQHTS